jgi:hypothetical protein
VVVRALDTVLVITIRGVTMLPVGTVAGAIVVGTGDQIVSIPLLIVSGSPFGATVTYDVIIAVIVK